MAEPSRAVRIETILAQRAPLAKRVLTAQQSRQQLTAALLALETKRDQLVGQIDDLEVKGQLRDLDFAPLQRKLQAERDTLERLHRRFARTTLNIGVIGRARQGKSRLLQSLSGLTSEQIPDGDRQHCTGVRSIIYHNPDVAPYAEVTFYTERAFLEEIIAPYYKNLKLGVPPLTFSEWRTTSLPPLPADQAGMYAEPRAKYEHLRRYYEHLDRYLPLLQAPSPRRIAPTDIRAYVAQDTLEGERIYFNYLAVREVKIVCTFPREDVGKIAMIDLPGLGDTGIGDQERLLQALSEAIDFVLFVRMPKAAGDYWADVDVQLYDLARSALAELPLERWSFMLLNRTGPHSKNGNNQPNCEDLRTSLAEKHIRVADLVIADCAQPTEVGELVLDTAVTYLITHMRDLDQQYARTCQERLDELSREIQALCVRARQALGVATGASGEFALFQRLFKGAWNDLTVGMERLLRSLREQRANPSPLFEQQVSATLLKCETDHGIPTIEDIEIRRDSTGAYGSAYDLYRHTVRTHLTRHFLDLDDVLCTILTQVRDQVATVLTNNGKLRPLSDAQGEAFIGALADLLTDDHPRLKQACTVLAAFQLSYRGFIQYRVRKCLDKLIPDVAYLPISSNPSAGEVHAYLRVLHKETLFHLEQELHSGLSDPSAAMFAIVDEFVDQILRSEGAEDEWERFYNEMRAEIWTEDFQKLGERSFVRQQWATAITHVVERVAATDLKFLG